MKYGRFWSTASHGDTQPPPVMPHMREVFEADAGHVPGIFQQVPLLVPAMQPATSATGALHLAPPEQFPLLHGVASSLAHSLAWRTADEPRARAALAYVSLSQPHTGSCP